MNTKIVPAGVGRDRALSDLLVEQFDEMRHRYGEIPVGPTGVEALDRLLGPVRTGWSTLIASGEAVGRTTLAVQMSMRHAATGGSPLWLSSTLTANEVALRVLAIEADIGVGKLVDTRLADGEWSRIERVVGGPRREMIVVDNVRRVRDLEAAVSRAVGEHGVPSVVVVDDVDVLLDDTRVTREGAFDVLEAVTTSLDTALILTFRLDSQDPTRATRTRLLDDIPRRAARNIVVLEAGEPPSGATAHVIRTAIGDTGRVALLHGPRSPRFYGAADHDQAPTDPGTTTNDALEDADWSDHDD